LRHQLPIFRRSISSAISGEEGMGRPGSGGEERSGVAFPAGHGKGRLQRAQGDVGIANRSRNVGPASGSAGFKKARRRAVVLG
jgi:hypothetical protein